MKVTATAPTRMDLAGGTLDLWPIHHLLSRKATVNVGVSLAAEVQLTKSSDDLFRFTSQDLDESFIGSFDEATQCQNLPLIGLLLEALWDRDWPPITVATSAKSPAGAGLGGSSCLAVALGAALSKGRHALGLGPQLPEDSLVQTAQNVEARLIHAPTGCQDYWGAVRGGLNLLTFPFKGVEVETFPAGQLPGLQEHLLLCYSGKSRASAINNWDIFKRLFDGDKELLSRFEEIGGVAQECSQAVRGGDLDRTLKLSAKEWLLRTALWPKIETDETQSIDKAAKQAGARFTRVGGAGGGGVMAIFCDPNVREMVMQACISSGGVMLDGSVCDNGLTVTCVD